MTGRYLVDSSLDEFGDRPFLRKQPVMKRTASESEIDELDFARAREYSLLGILLSQGPDAQLLSDLILLQGDATPLGQAHSALANAALGSSAGKIANEHFTLFAGLRDGGLCPYASYYFADTLYGRPLALLRDTLRELGIEKAPERPEPEDHIGFLCGIMAGLIRHEIPAPRGADRMFFDKHLSTWTRRLFVDLESTKTSNFYSAVGSIGRTFIDIETRAFDLPS
jgi:TorA maturation chaperone TorD